MGDWVPIGSTSHNGYLAVPDRGSGPGVLVLHAWWGLTPVFTEVCDRLAAAGFVALAPGLFPSGATAATIAEAETLRDAHDEAAAEGEALVRAAAEQLLARSLHDGLRYGRLIERSKQCLGLGDGRGSRLIGEQTRRQRHKSFSGQQVADVGEDRRQSPPGVQHQHTGTSTTFRHCQIRAIARRPDLQPLAHARLRTYAERPFGYSIEEAGGFAKGARPKKPTITSSHGATRR